MPDFLKTRRTTAMFCLTVALAAFPLAGVKAQASDQQKPETEVAELDPLLIESDDSLLRQVPAGQVVAPEQLDATGKVDTGDQLRDLAGVAGSRMGGHGIDIAIRGQKATQLNVLLDGAFIHGACPNRMDPPTSFADVLSYDEITVIKGVQSLSYGAGGSGGTVLFKRNTEAAAKGTHGIVVLKATNNGLRAGVSFDISHVAEEGWLRVFGGHKDAENYTDGAGRDWRTAFRSHNWGLVAGFRPGENQTLELGYEHSNTFDALFPGAGMDSPRDDASTVRLKYRLNSPFADLGALRIEAYRSQVDHLMDNYSLRPNPGMKMASPAHSDTNGLRVVVEEASTSGWGLEYGLDHKKTRRLASLGNPITGSIIAWTWPDVRTEISGAFLDAKRSLGVNGRLIASVRFDHVNAGAAMLHVPPPDAPMNTPSTVYQRTYGMGGQSVSESNPSGLLRYEHTAKNGLFWFLDINQTVRTADATERYFAKPDWVGNPAIAPEKHRQFDAGLARQGQRWKASANLFFDDVSDYILRDRLNGKTVYRSVNARIYGGEANFSFKPATGWNLDAAFSWTFGYNDTDGRYLPQIPAHEARISFEKTSRQWLYGVRLNAAARQNRVDPQSGLDIIPTPGWSTIDAYAQRDLSANWRVAAGIDNVLDREYAQHLNRKDAFGNVALVNEPGRTVWGRLIYRF